MAQFSSDTFTGTENAELTAYNAAWTRHASYGNNCEIVSGRLRSSVAVSPSVYYHSGAPASADYSVNADLYFLETDGGADGVHGVVGRCSTSANTLYMARYAGASSDRWDLYKAVAGTFTLLGSSAQSIASGTTNNVKLEMIGSAIKLFKQGSGTATISVTDTAITAAGKAGFRIANANNDTTGIHLDNFSADDAAAGGVTLTGISGTGQVGSVTRRVDSTKAVTGVAGAGQVGSVAASISVTRALTGVESTGAAGSTGVSVSATRSLNGVEATGAAGTVTTGANVTKAVTGVASTGQVGAVGVTKSGSAVLTGLQATGEVGSVAASLTVTRGLTGLESTGEIGNVGLSVSATRSLAGVESTGAVGSVAFAQSGSAILSGVQATGAVGSVSVASSGVFPTPSSRVFIPSDENRATLIDSENRSLAA